MPRIYLVAVDAYNTAKRVMILSIDDLDILEGNDPNEKYTLTGDLLNWYHEMVSLNVVDVPEVEFFIRLAKDMGSVLTKNDFGDGGCLICVQGTHQIVTICPIGAELGKSLEVLMLASKQSAAGPTLILNDYHMQHTGVLCVTVTRAYRNKNMVSAALTKVGDFSIVLPQAREPFASDDEIVQAIGKAGTHTYPLVPLLQKGKDRPDFRVLAFECVVSATLSACAQQDLPLYQSPTLELIGRLAMSCIDMTPGSAYMVVLTETDTEEHSIQYCLIH